jgi:hypothetical protein
MNCVALTIVHLQLQLQQGSNRATRLAWSAADESAPAD